MHRNVGSIKSYGGIFLRVLKLEMHRRTTAHFFFLLLLLYLDEIDINRLLNSISFFFSPPLSCSCSHFFTHKQKGTHEHRSPSSFLFFFPLFFPPFRSLVRTNSFKKEYENTPRVMDERVSKLSYRPQALLFFTRFPRKVVSNKSR